MPIIPGRNSPEPTVRWTFNVSRVVDGVGVFAQADFQDSFHYCVELRQPFPGASKASRYTMALARRSHNMRVDKDQLTDKGRKDVLETLAELYREAKARSARNAVLMDVARGVLDGHVPALLAQPNPKQARAMRKAWWAEHEAGRLSQDQLAHRVAKVNARVAEWRSVRDALVNNIIKGAFEEHWLTVGQGEAEGLLARALAEEADERA